MSLTRSLQRRHQPPHLFSTHQKQPTRHDFFFLLMESCREGCISGVWLQVMVAANRTVGGENLFMAAMFSILFSRPVPPSLRPHSCRQSSLGVAEGTGRAGCSLWMFCTTLFLPHVDDDGRNGRIGLSAANVPLCGNIFLSLLCR